MTGSGDRPDREPESASFEAARVGTRRGSPPLYIVGFLAVVGAFVAVGVGGRTAAEPTPPPAAIEVSGAVTPEPSPAPTPALADPGFGRAPAVGSAQLFRTGPGQIELEARRLPRSIYIHGDIFVPGVTWVFVSLVDGSGQVAGWASVSVPGAAGPARTEAPALRFDVEMALPEGLSGRLWLAANAYDARSSEIANVGLEVTLRSNSRMENEP